MNFKWSAFLLFTAALVACNNSGNKSNGNDTTHSPAKANQETATDTTWKVFKHGTYTVEYPANWEFENDQSTGSEFLLYTPDDTITPGFPEKLDLVIQSQEGASDSDVLDAYIKSTKNDISQRGGKIINSEKIQDSTGVYQKLSYELSVDGKSFGFRHLVRVHNKVIYLLTYYSTAANPELYRKEVDRIFSSFRVNL